MAEKQQAQEKQFDEVLLEVRRVTRVTTGGRKLSFRAVIIVGDRKGQVGLGISKSSDVSGAVSKATHEAYKNIIRVPIVGSDTVPYPISFKYKSAVIKLIPAAAGTGLKAGSAVRSVLDIAGYHNILSKIIGTNNKLNNALATLYALTSFKVRKESLKNADYDSKPVVIKADKSVEKKSTVEKAANIVKVKIDDEESSVPAKKATKKTTKKTTTKKVVKKTTKKTTK